MHDYRYDVFLSYERDSLTVGWIKEHFLPFFRTFLRLEVMATLRRQPLPIFFDKSEIDRDFPDALKQDVKGIPLGSDWDTELRSAIQASRCMVGIWNPPYFFSSWCNIEWRSFHKRASDTRRSLVFPATVHDGNSFPPEAAATQYFDFRPYLLFGPALSNSKRYEQFQEDIKVLARGVANALRDPPPFELFPLIEPPPPDSPPSISLSAIRF
jgi:hypothetical protein